MHVRFWGTRGSLAKPGPTTLRYGGNTSCVEVGTDAGDLLVLDCGTGAHELGRSLLRRGKGRIDGSLLIGHPHWDHIQGFPFFAPFFQPDNEWDIYAPRASGESLRETLAAQMTYPYFPVALAELHATLRYHDLDEQSLVIGNARIFTRLLNHPAPALGYRIEADGAAMVYVCDHEPYERQVAIASAGVHGADARHADFLLDADLVIHDAQYTAAEYAAKEGWGHSTLEYAIRVCEHAGVRRLAFTHHDPLRDDAAVDRLVDEANRFRGKGSGLDIVAASEGMVLELGAACGGR